MLVLEEIVSNIYKYAGLPDGALISVAVEVAPAELTMEVRDSGIEFDPLAQAQRAELGSAIDHASIGGLGVHLITGLTDSQSYRRAEGCNILRVTKLPASLPDQAAEHTGIE